MGMFRESGEQEIDIVKEMAESLGSSGLRVEELLEKATAASENARRMVACYRGERDDCEKPDLAVVNDSIREYNALVDKAEDALRWLLIQREACGFRRHRDVYVHYPIPRKIGLLKK
ncbi:MAG: hypothetical protein HY913_13850 [Desulfomonile tiedjei]|nr:hypothetical protein [Desulfomonile tiedjei]